MRKIVPAIMLPLFLFAFTGACLHAEPWSLGKVVDIGELMSTARKNFDLRNEDAVILFEGRKVFWLPDGLLRVYTHSIVWIGTGYGIRAYADLRVPYDDKRQSLKVAAVRTWMDNTWWEATETAIVETLPSALGNADAYTHMREMMLLRNGVELPCILETAYIIEDKEPFRKGTEGLWIFPGKDPIVHSWFTLGVPAGFSPKLFTSQRVPGVERGVEKELGLDTYAWKMGPLCRTSLPSIDDPAACEPHLTWSTFEDWKTLGEHYLSLFNKAQKLDDHLLTELDKLAKKHPARFARADGIANFVSENTRLISYDRSFWMESPRPAASIFSTAYGHALDRAVLAAALFKKAGFEAKPFYRSRIFTHVDEGAPCLARFEGPWIRVSGDGINAWYDPVTSSIDFGVNPVLGRTVWYPGEEKPVFNKVTESESASLSLELSLSYCEKSNEFKGRGTLSARGALSPYSSMQGLDNQAVSHLNAVVSGVISSAKVKDFNPVSFDPSNVVAGFQLNAPLPERDCFKRIPLVLGEPKKGLFQSLPHDVILHMDERNSPLYISGPQEQRVVVSFDFGELEIVRLPENGQIENDTGTFQVEVSRKGDTVKIARSLSIKKGEIRASEWPQLRSLLQADRHERNRIILLKKKTER